MSVLADVTMLVATTLITGLASTISWSMARKVTKLTLDKARAAGWTVTKPPRRHRRLGRRLGGASAWRITELAAFLAGRKRLGLRDEWRAHLAGEAGHELSISRKVAAALGFVAAAFRYRLQDAADLMWVPADAILKSRTLSNLVVWSPTAAAAVILFHHGGTDAVLADAESILAIGGILYALVRVGRWWRGVKPMAPPARPANKE